MVASVDQLIALLDLRNAGVATFTGRLPATTRARVFGGYVLGQALAAAGRTVGPARRPHSLHASFLRPGDPRVPIDYEVESLREGRAFSTRAVRASQGSTLICTMTASFHVDEPGLDFQRTGRTAPPPDTLPKHTENLGEWPDIYAEWSALDIRRVPPQPVPSPNDPDASSSARAWLRTTAPLPDDALLHTCLLACISDLTLLSVVLVPHGISALHEGYTLASLDHSIWFHRPGRVDEWLLYDQTVPSTSNALGLAHGRLRTADGTLIASVAQEGLFRKQQ
ncbi:acyl-CoA thioesterase II [Nocardioides immobilis]|uniref:Acyl-CoA thioesterase II n=1 Tax=Nocardioides immobilis TaxID=2049295 RepID=A0A417XU42_9ACTN|nr:acyl-CoA thioesterase II [Nocardioides immobilis]RHW24014.1 acyl-CoA thioesterase II [Nocardioides immobilis]